MRLVWIIAGIFFASILASSGASAQQAVAINCATGTTSTGAYIYAPASPTNPCPFVISYASTAGITPLVAGSSSSSVVLKAAAGNFYGGYVTTGATAGYLMIFNSTTAPSNGSTTAGTASGNLQECVVAPANTTTSISYIGAPPEVFTTGITLVFSSTACSSLTASATAYLHGSAF